MGRDVPQVEYCTSICEPLLILGLQEYEEYTVYNTLPIRYSRVTPIRPKSLQTLAYILLTSTTKYIWVTRYP